MTLNNLILYIYCSPLELIARYILLFSGIFLLLEADLGLRRWFRPLVGSLLLVWLAAVLCITVLDRESGISHLPALIPFHSYWEMYQTQNWEIGRSNFMNVAMCYPGGLLLTFLFPKGWSRRKRLGAIAAVFLTLSIIIEFAQYFYCLGRPEIDDVIHNTLGAILSCLMASLNYKLPEKRA